MYICENCKKVVEYLNTYTEDEQRHVDYKCKKCGGEFVEATECPLCDKYFDELETYCCKSCKNEILEVDSILKYLEANEKKQVEFFVNWWTDSDCVNASKDLITICKSNWIKNYKVNVLKEKAQGELIEFALCDLENYVEWLESHK